MTIATLYVLFGDDVRILAVDKNKDDIFYYLHSFCLGIFTLEILMSSALKREYFNGFFFWLDILSTGSIIFDIGWIS